MITSTPVAALRARQHPITSSSTASPKHCPTVSLPSGGVITVNGSFTVTLQSDVAFTPHCTVNNSYGDPFYASTTVFVYVIATTTLIAWVLLILLLINRRGSDAGRAPKPSSWFQGRGVTSAIAGRTPLGGLGNRPWLQKVAVFLVTVGLTVGSVDTFAIAQIQHDFGINNPKQMRNYVVGSTEIRVLRVISQVFVWLAQVQTLIRLFPRRKEKLIIKWFGFSLILCDLIFSCLNNFWVNSRSFPTAYRDAIPALTYLFQLAISLLYAAWVLYYVATKRRYAFFKPDELNMSIIAALSLTSIAIPVAFFIADISVPPVAGWGDFFRWTGAAAASVIVWEWVERIETVEREEKKDGILGREVFDEDELPTTEDPSRSATDRSGSDRGSEVKEKASSKSFGSVAYRHVRGFGLRKQLGLGDTTTSTIRKVARKQVSEEKDPDETLGTKLPEPKASFRPPSPPSRADTTSAGSTVYAVHYHPVQYTPPVPNLGGRACAEGNRESVGPPSTNIKKVEIAKADVRAQKRISDTPSQPPRAKLAAKTTSGWALATNAFKRRKRSPPLEIKKAMQRNGDEAQHSSPHQSRFEFKGRRLAFGTARGDRTTEPPNERRDSPVSQHPTVIPAPPRGQTWSPDILRHSPNNLVRNTAHVNPALAMRRVSHGPQHTPSPFQPLQAPSGRSTPARANSGVAAPVGTAIEQRATGTSSASPAPDGRNSSVSVPQSNSQPPQTGQAVPTTGRADVQTDQNSQSTDSESTAVGESSATDDLRPNS